MSNRYNIFFSFLGIIKLDDSSYPGIIEQGECFIDDCWFAFIICIKFDEFENDTKKWGYLIDLVVVNGLLCNFIFIVEEVLFVDVAVKKLVVLEHAGDEEEDVDDVVLICLELVSFGV